jgi:hypothetical protein
MRLLPWMNCMARGRFSMSDSTIRRSSDRGKGKANCNSCHREPLWTEPGWNQHTPAEMKIDGFEARRAPASIDAQGRAAHGYRTMNLAGVFVRERSLFMLPQDKGSFITTADLRLCSML